MKIRILINEKLKNKEKILGICKTNKFLKANQKNIIYYCESNWETVFSQITREILQEKKYDRLCVFANNGFLPFFYFSKEIGFVAACPFDVNRAKLCRGHNNANTVIITNRTNLDEIDDVVNAFFTTEFEGGRHITRFKLMQEPYFRSQITYKFNEDNCKNTIVLASDHAGWAFKEAAKKHLIEKGFKILDVGCNSLDSTHYPLYAIALVKNANKACCGIAFCSTGVGMANTINNFRGMNCFMCCLPGQAAQARSEYGANVMALGARFMNYDQCIDAIDSFVSTKRSCKPEIQGMNNYGFDLDMKKFKKIKIEGNVELPKELK